MQNPPSRLKQPADRAATEAHWIDAGRAILFVSANRSLKVVDVGTGAERVLFDAGERVSLSSPAVSPDGRDVAFRVCPEFGPDFARGKRAFMIVPVAGGEARELVSHQGPPASRLRKGQIAWAPDGRHLYFIDRGDDLLELWRIPGAGGKRERVGLPMAGTTGSLSVHPDGTRIAFHGPFVEPGTWVLENFLPKK